MTLSGPNCLQPETALQCLGLAATAYQVVQAEVFQHRWHPPTDVALPLFIGNVTAAHLQGLVSCLAQAYPSDHAVHWIASDDGRPGQRLGLSILTTAGIPAGSDSLLVPPLAEEASIYTLANILARLRAPGGCPWDQEQTLASMRIQILSEVHEVLEAIDLQDDENLQEELGDLIMDALFLIHIAQTEGKFQLADVVTGICQKMVRRHPHVYGGISLPNSDTVLSHWDEIKKAEKAAQERPSHPLEGIPAGLPALETARELQSKAHKHGIALPAWTTAADPPPPHPWTEERLGRALWHLVQAATAAGINAETALRRQNSLIRHHGQPLPDAHESPSHAVS